MNKDRHKLTTLDSLFFVESFIVVFCTYVCVYVRYIFYFMPGLMLNELSLSLSADDPTEADLWLLNSCTVKNPAEDHFRNSIKY